MRLDEVPKPYLVVLALGELGGDADLETIAVKAYEMFPQSFCWQRFPEYPDKDAVRVHLSDAKKPKFGALLQDSSRRGGTLKGAGKVKRYVLTPAGLEKAKELRPLLQRGEIAGSKKPLEYERLIAPLVDSAAFRDFKAAQTMDEIGREAFLLSMKLFADASPFIIQGRIARVLSAVERLPASDQRNDLLEYLHQGREAFDV